MKKAFLFLFGSSLLLLSSCDKIPDKERVKETGQTCGDCEVSETDEFITEKRVLMEEFTAMKCTYCPDGTRIANEIKDEHGEQFIIVSLHTGSLAAPDADHPDDFRTEVGDELYKLASSPAQPASLIDRLDYDTPQFVKFRQGDGWKNEVDEILANQPTADLGINTEVFYTDSTRSVCLTTKFKAVSDLSNRQLYWTAYLLESGIIAPQKDGSNTIEDYEHNHMLRASFNGTYGVPLPEDFDGTVDAVTCDSRELILDDEWVADNCAIVVFVYDNETFEVLQAVETHW